MCMLCVCIPQPLVGDFEVLGLGLSLACPSAIASPSTKSLPNIGSKSPIIIETHVIMINGVNDFGQFIMFIYDFSAPLLQIEFYDHNNLRFIKLTSLRTLYIKHNLFEFVREFGVFKCIQTSSLWSSMIEVNFSSAKREAVLSFWISVATTCAFSCSISIRLWTISSKFAFAFDALLSSWILSSSKLRTFTGQCQYYVLINFVF